MKIYENDAYKGFDIIVKNYRELKRKKNPNGLYSVNIDLPTLTEDEYLLLVSCVYSYLKYLRKYYYSRIKGVNR